MDNIKVSTVQTHGDGFTALKEWDGKGTTREGVAVVGFDGMHAGCGEWYAITAVDVHPRNVPGFLFTLARVSDEGVDEYAGIVRIAAKHVVTGAWHAVPNGGWCMRCPLHAAVSYLTSMFGVDAETLGDRGCGSSDSLMFLVP